MFGVLIYNEGYLAAFSGTLGGRTVQPGFVPPVYDDQQNGGYFKREEAEISAINHRLKELTVSPDPQKEQIGSIGREIAELRGERRRRSQALQQWLFSQYTFHNVKGERRTLIDIFSPVHYAIPSGTGDCCAPKLLEEAFRRGIEPLAIAEWNSADNRYYPPCTYRCRPILQHMLKGLDAEPDPELVRYNEIASRLETIYEDNDVVVVNKPSGLLSVPGRDFLPSVESITGSLSVHRLDQDTSGLMVLAKSPEVQRNLRRQFESRLVEKRYEALLEHEMPIGEEGEIRLPLSPDISNRPRQMVDSEHGKSAHTHYKVLDNVDGHAYVLLTPHTGRTHQLRIHCSSPQGINNPILGDRLYGAFRQYPHHLMLNACYLKFHHPICDKDIEFEKSSHQN